LRTRALGGCSECALDGNVIRIRNAMIERPNISWALECHYGQLRALASLAT
jgi:hypothetical protein